MGEAQYGQDEFASVFEAAFARLQVTLLEACAREDGWPQKIAVSVRAGLEFVAADPAAGLALTSEALTRGKEGVSCHERLLAYLGERLLPGRDEAADGPRLPEITERAMAGGVVALVSQRLDQGRASELPALAPEAIQFVLTPYLGGDEARRIAAESS
jgi:hypothetical protein